MGNSKRSADSRAVSDPTLERMALNPGVDDWNEWPVISSGAPKQDAMETETPAALTKLPLSPGASLGKPPAGKLFAEAGDQRRLF
jgi:hypothetical protein